MKAILAMGMGMAVLVGEAAAEIRVLSAGAVEAGLAGLAEGFQRETGTEVKVTFATAPAIRRRIGAGEAADVLIAPPAVLDDLLTAGRVRGEGRAVIGRVGVGVAVRADAPAPDLSSVAALKRAVLETDALVYNEASTGIYFARLLERLGIADQVRDKTKRYPDGAAVLEHVRRGSRREIGVGPITEITAFRTRGIKLAGPLPAEVQNYTTYAAGVMVGARSPEAAARFIRYLTTPRAKGAFAAAGIE